MLSVDYKLKGRIIGIRPSMTKFEAPQLTQIEIARAFDRPSPFYLNRPLIMVLEALGVPYEVFKDYQDAAVHEAENASKNLEKAARMFESFGLGTSYRLPSVMLHLHKLGVKMPKDPFYKNMMEFATNHVLRELKHHARIPIPGLCFLFRNF
jgi:RNA-dependent RNA polymerase